ncbi:MAG TPA: sigma-70 family RNA polymerase sigma factor [Acidimicrobiales bacterium]|nr:sigma-70 family RNA polymerase sigma factor [Acidimicrobiales bacterium]
MAALAAVDDRPDADNHPEPAGGELATLDFDDFFRQHYGRLLRALTAACGSREEAADAVQDAFVRAHQRWDRISRYEDPAAWVRRVAINRTRDAFRRAERGRRASLRLVRDRDPAPPPEPPSGALEAIADLPRQQRVAMALFYVHELSVREIAAAMDVSEGAVKFHLHEGRTKVRQRLDAHDD